ncbi:MAG: hypothetical protein GVY36_16160 [Verrucomicrobia bacterium]|jgi:hypothetical protein|nr:hypothetical protein [Verrucomicrobiota bacterium]
MMKRLLFLLSLLATVLMVVGCAKQSPAPAAARTQEPSVSVAWGEQVRGLQAGLSLKGVSKKPRTSVTLVLHVRNASESPLRILKLSSRATFWGECLPLDVSSAGTPRKYQGPVLEPPPPPPDSAYAYLQPGATDSVKVTMYPEHWKLAPSTEAEVAFVFQNQLQDVEDLWVGVARSEKVKVKVVPNTPDAGDGK